MRFRRALLKRLIPWLAAAVVLISVVWLIYSPYQRDLHQPRVDSNVGPLAQGLIFTQEFRSNVDNLARIDVLIDTYSRGNASSLILELYSDPRDDASYRVSSINTAGLVGATYYQWKFDPLPDSAGRKYVLSLWSPDASIDDSITLLTSTANVYPEGVAAINNSARPSESLGFSTYSHIPLDRLLISSVGKTFPVRGWHLAILAALIGPGFIFWSLSRLGASVLNDLPLAVGLSVALSPVLLLWGVPSPARASADHWFVGLTLLAIGVGLVSFRTIRGAGSVSWWSLLTISTAFLIAATRVSLYGGQQYPFSGDAVHHAIAAEMFRRDASVPSSWNPFALLDSFTFNFGFHIWAGDLAHALDLSSHSVVVLFGFVLIGLTAMSSGYLAERLCGRPLAGPLAAVLTGFLMPFPSFLLNWGRYPQIFSLVILALIIAVSVEALSDDLPWRQVPILALLLAGVLVGHFQTALLAAIFVIALLMIMLVRRQSTARLLGAIALSAVLTLPWLIRLVGHPPTLNSLVPTAAEWSTIYDVVGDPFFFTPLWALVAAGIGAVIVSLSRFPRALLLLIWIGLCWGLAAAKIGPLPDGISIGASFLQSAAYVIVTPLVAVTVAWIGEIAFVLISRATAGPNVPLGNRRASWGRTPSTESESQALVLRPSVLPTMVAIILGLTIALSTNQGVAPDPRYRLVYLPDVEAMQWLSDSADENTETLAMSELAIGDSTVFGTDAGWWLPLVGISTQLPPVVYLVESPSSAQSTWIQLMAADHRMSRPLDPDRWLDEGFEYLYVGVANRWKDIRAERPISLVYKRDGVRIYDLRTR